MGYYSLYTSIGQSVQATWSEIPGVANKVHYIHVRRMNRKYGFMTDDDDDGHLVLVMLEIQTSEIAGVTILVCWSQPFPIL